MRKNLIYYARFKERVQLSRKRLMLKIEVITLSDKTTTGGIVGIL